MEKENDNKITKKKEDGQDEGKGDTRDDDKKEKGKLK